jgi:hypothetical protein
MAVQLAKAPQPPKMPPADRVPVVYATNCRYCQRYRRACGRHESRVELNRDFVNAATVDYDRSQDVTYSTARTSPLIRGGGR